MKSFRVRLVTSLLLGIAAISVASTYFDVVARKLTLRHDLERRIQWLGAQLQPQLERELAVGPVETLPVILQQLRPYADQPGLAVYDAMGNLIASAGEVSPLKSKSVNLLTRPLKDGKESSVFARLSQPSAHLWFEDAIPLHDGDRTVGALVLVANADFIRTEGLAVWKRSFLRIAALVVLILVVTLAMVRWFLLQPLVRGADWLRRLRQGRAEVDEGTDDLAYLAPIAKEINSMAEDLSRARAAAETEARLRDAGETVWTANRLAVRLRERLGDGKLLVVSNREPYMHVRRGKETECVVPPSGVVTALEPVLQACDGTWVAHGSGNDDAAFVDEQDRLRVPPGDPRYTLRRVWLSEEEEAGYYEGFSNEGLWPLCHIAHTRPIFRAGDWEYYQRVNAKFALAVLEEIREIEHPIVFVQDYHFALLPALIKDNRPDARVAIFWHIPWPNAEAFGICPWQSQLLAGMLGADIIGFHVQSHCNNFLETIDRALEARTDWEHFSVSRNEHLSLVRPYPISVALHDDVAEQETISGGLQSESDVSAPDVEVEEERHFGKLHKELGIQGQYLVLGVDRMDYTKGIVERLLAIEQLLTEHPWLLEKMTFVQIAAPTRSGISAYVNLRNQVKENVLRINDRFGTPRWQPVILIERQCGHAEVERYYQAADICVVTSLHDGMNLVAKEFLAARKDGDGVLVLSRFAGAAKELPDALIVNPYDILQVAEAIHTGLEMAIGERHLRMERMRRHVKEYNVYRWAANVLGDLCAVRLESDKPELQSSIKEMKSE